MKRVNKRRAMISGNVGPNGNGFILPTLVIVGCRTRLNREEVFGPNCGLVRVADGEEALRLANDSDFGLTAIWTRDLTQALNYTDRLQAGTVWVNSHTLIDANPAVRRNEAVRYRARFGPDWLDDYCETKSVCVLLIFVGWRYAYPTYGSCGLPLIYSPC